MNFYDYTCNMFSNYYLQLFSKETVVIPCFVKRIRSVPSGGFLIYTRLRCTPNLCNCYGIILPPADCKVFIDLDDRERRKFILRHFIYKQIESRNDPKNVKIDPKDVNNSIKLLKKVLNKLDSLKN